MKPCIICKEVKPISEYYAHKAMGDGHLGKCKACCKAQAKKRYRDPEAFKRIVAYDQYRETLPERRKAKRLSSRRFNKLNPDKKSEYSKRYWSKYPDKRKAHQKLGNAVSRGKLKKLPCEKCGSLHSQSHHTDYSKPLEVKWLCEKHHKELHRKNARTF